MNNDDRQREAANDGEGERFLIVGLGNTGRNYAGNRHNIGFMAVDRLAAKYGLLSNRVQNKALVANGRLANHPVILAKPQTMMNGSGDAVGPLAKFYKVPPANVLVIYDEIDIDFGMVRIREKGSSGGHNGMRSVIQHLGQEFPRIRLGVGRPNGKMPVHAYVLQDFAKDDLPLVDEMLETAVAAVETFLSEGINMAMNKYNTKRS
ncbi:MAG: aminoacyl-tRNA hydrolase [Ardenticatenaceae bacterium]|nr:aminoacyl-tRNA hydrolase [Ardenticatenaceae bacterium]